MNSRAAVVSGVMLASFRVRGQHDRSRAARPCGQWSAPITASWKSDLPGRRDVGGRRLLDTAVDINALKGTARIEAAGARRTSAATGFGDRERRREQP